MEVWTVVAASRCGTSHLRRGERRQDAFRAFTAGPEKSWLVAIASDGAGSAAMGAQGAAIACWTLGEECRRRIESEGSPPDDDTIWSWFDLARDRISTAATRRGLLPRDFGATVLLLLSDGSQTLVAHIGDGAAVARGEATEPWIVLSWPESGEYAGTTYFLIDDPAPRLRITRISSKLSAASIFTDGLERLILDFATRTPHEAFFSRMIAPLGSASSRIEERELSQKLGDYLNSHRVNERTDDDKTLILAHLAERQ